MTKSTAPEASTAPADLSLLKGNIYKQRPFPGDKWRRRKGGKTETRTVQDRTLGGDVIYLSGGRSTCSNQPQSCTFAQWQAWIIGARFLNQII